MRFYTKFSKEYKGEAMKRKGLLTERNEFKGSFLPYTSFKNREWEMVDEDLWVYTNRIVNICIIQNENKELIMVDAGDAVVTVKQEAFWAVLTQRYSLNGPPAYFTPNKIEAKKTIAKLLQLPIRYLVTGHGPIIKGQDFIEKDLKILITGYDG